MTAAVLIIAGFISWIPASAAAKEHEQKIVTRIEHVTLMMKGRKMLVHADGMGRTRGTFGHGGQLVPRNSDHEPNKEGLLEYNLMFNATSYTGFDLKPIKASRTERSVPPGIKGVRVYSEYNHMDAMVPEPKKRRGFQLFGRKKTQESQ